MGGCWNDRKTFQIFYLDIFHQQPVATGTFIFCFLNESYVDSFRQQVSAAGSIVHVHMLIANIHRVITL